MNVTLAASQFPPLALGFFGLGVGYLSWRPQELFGFPGRDERVDRSLGVWGVWMPGLCPLLTGLILFVGLTWFQVFATDRTLHLAALALSAFAVTVNFAAGYHWTV